MYYSSQFNIKTMLKTYSLVAIVLLLAAQLNLHGQGNGLGLLKDSYEQLQKMDYRPLKTNYLLNKGFFLGQDLGIYKVFSNEDKEKNMIFNSPQTFQRHLRGLKRSELKEVFLITEEELEIFLLALDSNQNEVPIGIINLQGEWLKGYEVDENVQAKKENRSVNKIYQKINFMSASVLIDQVATPQVNFIIDDFVYFDEANKIQKLEIDFGDSQGYRPVEKGDRIFIDYEFPGEKAIAIKMKTNKGTFYNYSAINILAYERQVPDEVFELKNTTSTYLKSLTGGRAELVVGCDRILDKPVIVVEGFDPTNTNGIADYLQRITIPSFLRDDFLREGYDMIYLNFNNGGDDIRTNSTVLQNLIRDVNKRKIGSQDIIVIGASMGGLVARHAIRRLEQSGYTHNISHYISYDSPHKGANVPVGFQTLLLDVDDVFIRDVFNIGQSVINEAKTMLDSKAARQMLLRYKGTNPHSDFTTFQNELNTLGFPSQGGIRNIAIVNGSKNGTQQAPVNDYNPGDKIVSVNWVNVLPLGLVNAFVDVRTNGINTNTKVSSIWITASAIPTTIKEKSYNFNAINFDISAGGISPTTAPTSLDLGGWGIFNFAEWFGSTLNTYGREDFAFVPLFSSVASTENLTSQASLNRSVQFLQSNGRTPFHAIFAGVNNTEHIRTSAIPDLWNDLLRNELGINTPNFSCTVGVGSMGGAPTPYINGSRFYMCEYDRNVQFWDNDAPAIANLYAYNWTVTGPQPFPPSSGETYIMDYPTPGYYTLSLNRSYTSSINGTISSTYSRVIRSYPYWDPYYGCDEGLDIRSSNKDNIFVVDGLKIFPNPNDGNILNVSFKMIAEQSFELLLYSIDGKTNVQQILNKGKRQLGTYTDTYDISNISSGTYIVQLRVGDKISNQKLFIQK